MSDQPINQALAFFAKVDEDPELQRAMATEEAHVLAIAKEAGFEFTATDLREALRQRYGIKSIKATTDAFTLK